MKAYINMIRHVGELQFFYCNEHESMKNNIWTVGTNRHATVLWVFTDLKEANKEYEGYVREVTKSFPRYMDHIVELWECDAVKNSPVIKKLKYQEKISEMGDPTQDYEKFFPARYIKLEKMIKSEKIEVKKNE